MVIKKLKNYFIFFILLFSTIYTHYSWAMIKKRSSSPSIQINNNNNILYEKTTFEKILDNEQSKIKRFSMSILKIYEDSWNSSSKTETTPPSPNPEKMKSLDIKKLIIKKTTKNESKIKIYDFDKKCKNYLEKLKKEIREEESKKDYSWGYSENIKIEKPKSLKKLDLTHNEIKIILNAQKYLATKLIKLGSKNPWKILSQRQTRNDIKKLTPDELTTLVLALRTSEEDIIAMTKNTKSKIIPKLLRKKKVKKPQDKRFFFTQKEQKNSSNITKALQEKKQKLEQQQYLQKILRRNKKIKKYRLKRYAKIKKEWNKEKRKKNLPRKKKVKKKTLSHKEYEVHLKNKLKKFRSMKNMKNLNFAF